LTFDCVYMRCHNTVWSIRSDRPMIFSATAVLDLGLVERERSIPNMVEYIVVGWVLLQIAFQSNNVSPFMEFVLAVKLYLIWIFGVCVVLRMVAPNAQDVCCRR
jgi:hypothetical protein